MYSRFRTILPAKYNPTIHNVDCSSYDFGHPTCPSCPGHMRSRRAQPLKALASLLYHATTCGWLFELSFKIHVKHYVCAHVHVRVCVHMYVYIHTQSAQPTVHRLAEGMLGSLGICSRWCSAQWLRVMRIPGMHRAPVRLERPKNRYHPPITAMPTACAQSLSLKRNYACSKKQATNQNGIAVRYIAHTMCRNHNTTTIIM